jgi:hypothetical protein
VAQNCIVRIPTPYKANGTGCNEYTIKDATSSLDAARQALRQHAERIDDNPVVTVILAERSVPKPDRYPQVRHRVGRVRSSA